MKHFKNLPENQACRIFFLQAKNLRFAKLMISPFLTPPLLNLTDRIEIQTDNLCTRPEVWMSRDTLYDAGR